MVLAGVSLGLYVLNWHGALFFVAIIGLWFIVQFYTNPDYALCKKVSVLFLVSFLLSWNLFLLLGVFGPILLGLLHYYSGKQFHRLFWGSMVFALVFLVSGIAGIGYWILMHLALVFWGFGSFVAEARPMGISHLIATYHILSITGIVGLYLCIKNKVNSLFIIWCIVILLANIGQIRWNYYGTICIAILSAYTITYLFAKLGKPDLRKTVALVAVCAILISPGIRYTIGTVAIPNPIEEWREPLIWMRENAVDPFPNLYDSPDHTVLSWWSYSPWIIRVARQVPISYARHHNDIEINFYTSVTEEESENVIRDLGVRYVIMPRNIERVWSTILMISGKDLPLRDSVAFKLWNEQLDGWKMIHQSEGVRIFERLDWRGRG